MKQADGVSCYIQPLQYESKASKFFELKTLISKRLQCVKNILDNYYNVKKSDISKSNKNIQEEINNEIRIMREDWKKMNVIMPKSKLSSTELNLKLLLNKLYDDIEALDNECKYIFNSYNSNSTLGEIMKDTSQLCNENWIVKGGKKFRNSISKSREHPPKSILRSQSTTSANSLTSNKKSGKKVRFSSSLQRNAMFSLEHAEK